MAQKNITQKINTLITADDIHKTLSFYYFLDLLSSLDTTMGSSVGFLLFLSSRLRRVLFLLVFDNVWCLPDSSFFFANDLEPEGTEVTRDAGKIKIEKRKKTEHYVTREILNK